MRDGRERARALRVRVRQRELPRGRRRAAARVPRRAPAPPALRGDARPRDPRRGDRGRAPRRLARDREAGRRRTHPRALLASGSGRPPSVPMKVGEMAETLPPSAPPPSTGPPGTPVRHEHVLELEAARSWKRRRSADFLKLNPLGMELHHARALREPLAMPLGAIAVAIAEPGAARAGSGEGRFPILRRLSATAIVPQVEGVEGWLWTSTGGSAFPSVVEEDEAPNAA